MLEDEQQEPDRDAVYRVGAFEVHAGLNTISREARTVRCEPRVIDVLMCLIRHAPGTVSKPQLLAEVWPATAVGDDAIWRCVSELRRVFEDSAKRPRYIETIPRRGYRLIATVDRVTFQDRPDASPQPLTEGEPPKRFRVPWPAVAALVVLLSSAAVFFLRPIAPSPPPDKRAFASFSAFSAFNKGRQLNHRGTPDVVARAVEHLEIATDLDPHSALAHSELTRALVRAGRLRVLPGAEAFDKAKRAAVRAVALDQSLGAAHAALGSVLFWHDRHWSAAATAWETALALDPGDARARRDHALFLGALGRHQEAKAEIERAWRLDELSPLTSLDAGWIYYYGGRFDDAVEECRFARDLLPASAQVRSCLVAAYLQGGRYGEALEVVQELANDRGIELSVPNGGGNREALAVAVGDLFASTHPDGNFAPISAVDAARLHMTLGQVEPALRWLEQAMAEGYASLVHLNVDPCFRSLHTRPRFRALLQQLGFGDSLSAGKHQANVG